MKISPVIDFVQPNAQTAEKKLVKKMRGEMKPF